MDRAARLKLQRRRFAIALIASVGFHALLLTLLRIDVPELTERQEREIALLQLPEDMTEQPLEVVALGDAPAGPQTSSASASSPVTRKVEPGTITDSFEPAILELTGPASASVGEIQLAVAVAVEEATLPLRQAQRGVVLRQGGAASAGRGVTFRPASAAAREAGRDRRGDGIGGLGGIGVVIGGGLGGDPICKPRRGGTSTLPGVVGQPRGLGGLPVGTPGGFVPRPRGTGVVDRFVPGVRP